MQSSAQESIRKVYYTNELEPTERTLEEILKITTEFQKNGAQRLLCALSFRKRDEEEIQRWTKYLREAGEKMEKEYRRAKSYKEFYNSEYATDVNGYFDSVGASFSKIRSHMSPLKSVLRKGCPHNHPSEKECLLHGIASKSVLESSVLGTATFQLSLFPIEEQPEVVQELYYQLESFFQAEEQCIDLCQEMIEEEKRLIANPELCEYLLNKYGTSAWRRLRNQIYLFAKEAISFLRDTCPVYQKQRKYPSVTAFAQGELHKHNTAEMDHFFLVKFADAQHEHNIDTDMFDIYGDDPDAVNKVLKVIKNFDSLLPEYFTQSNMGQYINYFCQWANAKNISSIHAVFIKRYPTYGKYKTVKYGTVSSHAKKFKKDTIEYKEFLERIKILLSKDDKIEDQMNISTIMSVC